MSTEVSLEEREDGLTYLKGSNTPYTGSSMVESEDGVLEQTESYKDGLLDGYCIEYYQDYSMKIMRCYDAGKPDGTWKKWYESGQEELKYYYKDGLLHGIFTQWYENGQKEREVQFWNDKEYGVALYWYENGNLSERTTHRKDGGESQMIWHEDGKKHFFCESPSDNRETILWREWDKDGKIEADMSW